MARLENVTFDEIVTHLECELEFNRLEEGDDIPVQKMSTALTAPGPGFGLFFFGIDPGTTYNYCNKPVHIKDDCSKLKRKEKSKHNDGQCTKPEYPKWTTYDKLNHPAERRWKGTHSWQELTA